jgi:predicted metal-dependent hydrolase
MSTPTDVSPQPRDLRFDLEAHRGTHWMNGDPVGTAVFNALSLTFPDGEKMFMDSVRHYRSRLTGRLAEDVRAFLAQEAIHAREHHALNSLIDRGRYPVAEIESRIRKRIAFARKRGPIRMLCATTALEHFTAMMAETHDLMQDKLFGRTAPELERLWRWHSLEETEHKAVAFDVFMEVTRDWPAWRRYMLRVWSMVFISFMFTRNITQYASLLLQAEGYAPREARKAVRRFLWGDPGIFRANPRTYFAWYRPGFHPWDIDNRAQMARWQAEFAAETAAAGIPAAGAISRRAAT